MKSGSFEVKKAQEVDGVYQVELEFNQAWIDGVVKAIHAVTASFEAALPTQGKDEPPDQGCVV